jgi:chromosome segregation ATPase
MASQGEEVVEAATTAAGGDAPSAPSTWAKAREASHQMILQAAMEDLESKASKVAAELIESQTRAEQQEKSLTSMRAQVELLQASVDEKSTKLQAIQSDYQDKLGKCQSLEETSKSNGERMDRLDAEADALREEIRYDYNIAIARKFESLVPAFNSLTLHLIVIYIVF